MSEYATITKNSGGYTITFKNYVAPTGKTNTVTITNSDLADFQYVYGDFNTRIFAAGIVKLAITNDSSIENKEYAQQQGVSAYLWNQGYEKLLSNYVFGVAKHTGLFHYNYGSYTNMNQTQCLNAIEHYINGDISNLIFAFHSSSANDSLGIVGDHAYAIKALNKEAGYIELVNPWDDNDCLRLSLEFLFNSSFRIHSFTYERNEFISNYMNKAVIA